MKFVVTTRIKDTFSMLPIERQAALMEGATAMVEKYRKAGICKEIYAIPSLKASVSIWEIDTAEKGAALYRENPLFPFQDVDQYVISDFNEHMNGLKNIYQQLLANK